MVKSYLGNLDYAQVFSHNKNSTVNIKHPLAVVLSFLCRDPKMESEVKNMYFPLFLSESAVRINCQSYFSKRLKQFFYFHQQICKYIYISLGLFVNCLIFKNLINDICVRIDQAMLWKQHQKFTRRSISYPFTLHNHF